MTCAELALAVALDREWEAQSGRGAPLESTVPVRTALELVLAGTPGGIFAARWVAGATPDEVVAEVREALPEDLSAWTRRSLDRVGALRSAPRLAPAEELAALPPRTEELAALPPPTEELAALPPAAEPIPIGPHDIPQLSRPSEEPVSVVPAATGAHPEPVARHALPERLRPAAIAAPLGAGIAATVAALDVGVLAAAGGGALVAALVARLLGGRR